MPLALQRVTEERRRLAHLPDAARRRRRASPCAASGSSRPRRPPAARDSSCSIDGLGVRLGQDQHAARPPARGGRRAAAPAPATPRPRRRGRGSPWRASAPHAWSVSVDLPMPGIAADQHDRALHQAAAEHAVELAEPGRAPDRLLGAHRRERPRRGAGRRRRAAALARLDRAPPPRPASPRPRRPGTARASAAARARTAGRRTPSGRALSTMDATQVDKRDCRRHHRPVHALDGELAAELDAARRGGPAPARCARSQSGSDAEVDVDGRRVLLLVVQQLPRARRPSAPWSRAACEATAALGLRHRRVAPDRRPSRRCTPRSRRSSPPARAPRPPCSSRPATRPTSAPSPRSSAAAITSSATP